MRHPLLSVIIPAHAAGKYIGQCLESIAGQSLGDIEVVVVDDASPDDTRDIIEAFARRDRRFRLFANARRRNAYATRLQGFMAARGDYLVPCDADDAMPPSALIKLYTAARRTGADIVHGRTGILGENGGGVFHAAEPFLVATGREYVRAFLCFRRGWSVWGKIYRREPWLRARPELPTGKNWFAGDDLFMSYLLGINAGGYAAIADTVYRYRPPAHGYFSRPDGRAANIRGQLEILRRLVDINRRLHGPVEDEILRRACRYIAGVMFPRGDGFGGAESRFSGKTAFGLEVGQPLSDNRRGAVALAREILRHGNIREARIAFHRVLSSVKRRGIRETFHKLTV